MASRTKQPATPRTAAEHLSRQTDSGTSSADGYLTSSDGQWTAKIWYPGDPESTFSGKVDGKDYSCKGLDIMDSTADYDKWWEEQADQETLTAAASLWPVKVRLDDVMVYIAIRMFSATERAKRFPADFDNNGNIRTTRPHFGGGCRVQTRTGCQFYIIYKGYYCLTGVDVPDVAHSAMGLGTMTHGRATFRDSTSLSFGRVALTRLSSDKVGFVLYRYTAGPKEIPFPKSPQPEDTPADTLEHQLGMRPIMMAPWTSTANREIFDAGARAEQMTEETWFRLENMDVSNPLHKLDEILAERQHRRSQLSAANTDQDSTDAEDGLNAGGGGRSTEPRWSRGFRSTNEEVESAGCFRSSLEHWIRDGFFRSSLEHWIRDGFGHRETTSDYGGDIARPLDRHYCDGSSLSRYSGRWQGNGNSSGYAAGPAGCYGTAFICPTATAPTTTIHAAAASPVTNAAAVITNAATVVTNAVAVVTNATTASPVTNAAAVITNAATVVTNATTASPTSHAAAASTLRSVYVPTGLPTTGYGIAGWLEPTSDLSANWLHPTGYMGS
ncbi:hypothetical protein B0A52_01790 [Exophiala mesophila]|uniref:Uncharacterized protein n=1 Tax=Exophiala mesophila TaxID=212818 RepID=A0A438NG12_EXOME|nr:hypothetical protein B0A52_01790 [Exophiala mesophila]